MTSEPLIEQRRADALAALIEPGRQRRAATTSTRTADETLHPLVIAAVDAGCSYRRIRDVTGLSLDTIGTWARDTR